MRSSKGAVVDTQRCEGSARTPAHLPDGVGLQTVCGMLRRMHLPPEGSKRPCLVPEHTVAAIQGETQLQSTTVSPAAHVHSAVAVWLSR